jgi:hypothetical protein
MIVKCIINQEKDLESIFLVPQDGYSKTNKLDLTIGNYYIVYGMTLRAGYVWYYIHRDKDKNSKYPFWHPCGLFEVVNGQLSKYWVYSFVQEKMQNRLFTQTMWAYPEWANNPYYYDLLTDEEEIELNIFIKYKSLMDLEFPSPWIKDKAEAMDDHWLFCSYCIDAWQSFSTDGMVVCPTCGRMMHNPNYINPLKTLSFLD